MRTYDNQNSNTGTRNMTIEIIKIGGKTET